MQRNRERLGQALELHQRAEQIAVGVYGTDSPAYARVLANLAIAYAEAGDADQAQALGRRAVELAPGLFTESEGNKEGPGE